MRKPTLPLCAFFLLAAAARAETAIPGVTASTYRPAYPLLVRNPICPLVRVEVNIGKIEAEDIFDRNDVALTSLTGC